MRSLLLNINPDSGHPARLATAIALARGVGGHVTCLQTMIAPLTIGDPESAALTPRMMEAMERAAAAFQEEVESQLDAAGLGCTWIRLFGDPATIIVSHSRLADVVILSAEGEFPTIGSVALHMRAPVLAVPEKGYGFDLRAPVLIAWNGSHAGANALRASVSLLRQADSVHILVVDEGGEEFPAARASEYLSYQAVASEIHRCRSEGKTVAEAILAFAPKLRAGTIVAGAFGHNRLRELLLGSVTRALLKQSPLPLLLTH